MDRRRFGRTLRRYRNAKEFSQAALARQVGVTREYLLRLEDGQNEPTLGLAQRLAKALGVTVNDLLQ